MNFLKQLKANEDKPHSVKFTNIDFSLQDINNKLKSVNQYEYKDLVNIIYNSYETILDDIFMRNMEMRSSIIEAFNDINFVKAFIEVISNSRLSETQVFSCNKIAWDYMSSGHNNKVKEELLHLSNIINSNVINMLSTKIDIYNAKMLALARFSSIKEKENTRRVNSILYHTAKELSIQTIIDIYSVLYRNITPLFKSIMYNIENETCNVDNYDNVALAIFHILDDMPSDEIRTVLYSYAEDHRLINSDCKVRFDVTEFAVKNNFIRVTNIINHLVENEGIKMP